MTLDKTTLKKIAQLAKLKFDPSAEESMLKDMKQLLSWVEQLQEVDTKDVKPLTSMSSEVNALREDKVGMHLEHSKALENAPKQDGSFFRVPKVVE
ncbi:MAG: Asp-tRNA(Asn)/Glu-tRNA(Gln) amidotransferase subunit GatC [Bacteroidota bacterium]|jgi:aspartyl-tRNA(Asn)/glutamyl-tRNA(Gln) amidotransferase subunit C|nr:Asp-tRNA(Asn)/Glu-tRNA(Gln) amidotransferase subunit GatC [Algoriphagus sp.]